MKTNHPLMLVLLSALLIYVHSAPNPFYLTPTSGQCSYSDYCPSYCTYTISSNRLVRQCNFGQTDFDSGGCTACDSLLFVKSGSYCIPHGLNNEYKAFYVNFYAGISSFSTSTYRLGWYNHNVPLGNTNARLTPYFRDSVAYQVNFNAATDAHYAVRIRFSIYMYRNDLTAYYYPITYSLDGTTYTYDQTQMGYWSCNDIVTSPLQSHFSMTLNVTWLNTNTTDLPLNKATSTCSNCDCYYTSVSMFPTCCCSGCSTFCCSPNCAAYVDNCCDQKYVQINDLLVFISKCQKNCNTCTSATSCQSCAAGYLLNYADNQCYTTCPQATYKNTTMYQIGGYTPIGGTYVMQNQIYCVPCSSTCLQCLNSTYCTRCYTLGRNESYLFNNTCINPCVNGYVANMTNHTCDCPDLYHFPLVNMSNFTMYCYPCAFECVRCNERTNLNCTQCQKGFYLANGTTHCLNHCPLGQFINSDTQTCYLCDVSCSACANSSTTCTQCFTNTLRYLFGNLCLDKCPWGYSWNNITRVCELCDIYTYSYQGKCESTCPSMHQANFANRSCIPYAKTNMTFSLVLESIHVMNHGKLLQYTILAQDGLNTSSQNWMKRYSYQLVQIVYGDSRISNFVGVRTLQNTTLQIRNLNYSNNRITYTTNVPDYMDYHKSFQVIFLNTIYSSQDIKYNNYTNVYNINQHPELLKQYYTYSAKNYCDLILLPFIAILLFLYGLYLKGTYEMFIQLYRVVQLLGVLLYSAFPVGSFTFYFLIGCSYSNFDFVPNLYAMMVKSDSSVVFASYFLGSDDMDFIRLMGSILLFGFVSLIVYIFCRYVLKFKQGRLEYMSKLCIDLMQVKIFHSFWSSLLYIISNYQESQFSMFMIFIFAIIFLGALIGRRYSIWKQTNDFSAFFVWRGVSTLLVCFVAMANEIVISIIVIISLVVTLWYFFLLHSSKYLVNINNLSSSNYMDEKTYKVLNNYDLEVPYSFSISFRNIIIGICPFVASLIIGVLIMLRDQEFYSIIFSAGLIYLLTLFVIINTIFIYLFLKERRKFLVQNKLQYLKKKYNKIGINDTQFFEERKRPRQTQNMNFDQQKYLETGPANRNMMKTFD